jgi:glycine cleavage system H protein
VAPAGPTGSLEDHHLPSGLMIVEMARIRWHYASATSEQVNRSDLDKLRAAKLDGNGWFAWAPARASRCAPALASSEEVMETPAGLKYSKEHEWVAAEDSVATIGITDFAQEQLGEIVYVELPAVGDKVSKDDPFGVVESVKAVSDIFAPISGTVVEVNQDLPDSPETVNEDPYGDGWLIKIKVSDTAELDDLMDNEEYEEMVAAEKE